MPALWELVDLRAWLWLRWGRLPAGADAAAGEGRGASPFAVSEDVAHATPSRNPAASHRYRWGADEQRPIAVDTPPPPQRTATETHYVPYETDGFARAHQWASEQVARKYPGSIDVLTTLDSLIKQQLNADS